MTERFKKYTEHLGMLSTIPNPYQLEQTLKNATLTDPMDSIKISVVVNRNDHRFVGSVMPERGVVSNYLAAQVFKLAEFCKKENITFWSIENEQKIYAYLRNELTK